MGTTPATIGQYTISRQLGQGAMGVVYLAHDSRLNRDVAIKTLPEHLNQDADRLARFEREARALASLNHPNIAGIHAIEHADDSHYLVLEHVEGVTIEQRLKAGAIPFDDALDLAIQIASGMEAAHEAGVIHRDLKPANIMVTEQGVAKILDFGLARADDNPGSSVSQKPTLMTRAITTEPGAILGTAAYMAPEQARGKRVDARADIWSLGVILYEMLTGTNPFLKESAADSISAVLSADIDMSSLPSPTTDALRWVLARCLERDASRRKQSMGDVRADIEVCRETPANAQTQRTTRVVRTHVFKLTGEICKSLDREGFDPLLLGWEMRYADNHHDSNIEILWIPSFGGDHTSTPWRHLLESVPCRMVVPTPIGLDPATPRQPSVSLENQLAIYRCFARHIRNEHTPKALILAGFSCGSITALRTAATEHDDHIFDALLAIDADLDESDCTVTGQFARLNPDSQDDALKIMKDFAISCETMQDWVIAHEHLFQCANKLERDMAPLIQQGKDFSGPFQSVAHGTDSPVVEWLHDAIENVPTVRLVFPSTDQKLQRVAEIRMAHLDTGRLGSKFSEDTFQFTPYQSHEEMLKTESLVEIINAFVDSL